MEKQKLSPLLTNELSEIYAWTIDFFRLEKGEIILKSFILQSSLMIQYL